MKLSVVIPFCNEIDLIPRSVNSVLANLDFDGGCEIIICNDGPYSSIEIISSISASARKLVTVIPNAYRKGPGGARNSGLDACSGECIAFLDADDFWMPGKIVRQLESIKQGASFVPTAYRFDASQAVVQPPLSIHEPIDIFLRRGIGTSTVMVSRALVADHRFKDIRFAQDIDYWYALARSPHFRYAAIDECLVEYSTGGSTNNKWVQLQYLHKVLRINQVPWLRQVRVLSSYVLAGVYNHYIKRLFT